MNPISVTVTGCLGDDPRKFTFDDGTLKATLRLGLDLPPRGENGREITRWVKVTAFGNLAANVLASLHKGERVTVTADDITAESWIAREPGSDGKPRAGGQVTLRATDISASMLRDTLTTGYTARKADYRAAASGKPSDLPVGQQADARVLAGVIS